MLVVFPSNFNIGNFFEGKDFGKEVY